MRPLNHIGITVSNIERSIEFYTMLGIQEPPADWVFTISGKWLTDLVQEDDAEIRVAFLPIQDGVVLELLEYQHPAGEQRNAKPNRDVGAMHIAVNVADIDQAYDAITAAGYTCNSEPQTVAMGPWKGNRVVYVSDPDGTPVELVESV